MEERTIEQDFSKKRDKKASSLAKQPEKQYEKPVYRYFHDPSISSYQIREVEPYIQSFDTFAKGRWLGRTLLDVVTAEFGGFPKEYWLNAISNGFVRINGQKVQPEYVIRNEDKLAHRAHRHEPMVFGEIQLVGETSDLLAVSKPSSIPMHPCGAYRFNSLEYILKHEPLVPGQPQLFLVHRLDRLTSGLVILAKSKQVAARVSAEIRGKSTEKIYFARVKGRFPRHLARLRQLPAVDFAAFYEDDGREEPAWRGQKRKAAGEADGEAEDEEAPKTSGPFQRTAQPLDELLAAPAVGCLSRPIGRDDKFPAAAEYPAFPQAAELAGTEHWVQCPLAVLSYREGVHACASDGRPSLSRFRGLGYDAASDTSLVECKPFTGRTHQLRLHLQLLGNPIANDPCYGGELFFGDAAKKATAVAAIERIRASDHRPLSRIPHFVRGSDGLDLQLSYNPTHPPPPPLPQSDKPQEGEGVRPGESEEEFLVRTCKNCREHSELVRLEHVVHCDGIWLHALRYSGRDWSFQTAFPDWAAPFQQPQP